MNFNAVVTGASKGIGFSVAKRLAEAEFSLFIVGRDNARLLEAKSQLLLAGAPEVHTFSGDLSQSDVAKRCTAKIFETWSSLTVLVNNAGVNDGVGLEKGNYERFMQSLHKNLIHYYMLAHHALPALIEAKGSIVNITSKTAETGQGNTSAYAAANGGRNALTREWAVELLKYGIRVNAVVVAECYTPAYEKWIQTLSDPDEKLKEICSKIPLENRMTSAEEIANAVAFLLSKVSSHTTGQIVHVDGGYVHLDRALANA
jgi:L-fucose dehydrogenase